MNQVLIIVYFIWAEGFVVELRGQTCCKSFRGADEGIEVVPSMELLGDFNKKPRWQFIECSFCYDN
jgi:hypothetical protein